MSAGNALAGGASVGTHATGSTGPHSPRPAVDESTAGLWRGHSSVWRLERELAILLSMAGVRESYAAPLVALGATVPVRARTQWAWPWLTLGAVEL